MIIRPPHIPAGIIDAIQRKVWAFITPTTIFHSVSAGSDLTILVIGDPGNAAYEWVVWDAARNAIADWSNDGWTSPASALRHALNKFDV